MASGLKVTFAHTTKATKRRNNSYVDKHDYFAQSDGLFTLNYPFESLPIPDNGRYRLHNEIDDCIVCDKCAIVCPVDCIAIEAVKSPEPIGETSDGSVKRLWAAKFDIDMAKCCYCGLCTTVCPTECLTMTKAYDYSEFDIKNMTYHFTNLSPEQAAEKKALYEQFVKEKEAAKAASNASTSTNASAPSAAPKPKMGIAPPNISSVANATETPKEDAVKPAPSKPAFKPVIKKPGT